ncbi:terminase large subunit [Clostridium botulinum C]|uniref:terminase large subunit n=1 Tax=Clostridium botulinum TaxID=1491 RepID=UPI001E33E15C|nr:terminase TerL endonuclease subunit [Clostridium botulinum]MCD3217874.1 terminase large subunit [Clostridium botulinum C]
MTILEELKQYANYCLEDKYISEYEDYISCEKHKWACERFLKDIQKQGTEEFTYVWNETEAEKIVKWFTYLRHKKGILAGQPIHLTIWQKFILCQIYGWRHKDSGYKRFTLSFIEVARKQAKSQMEAGVILYEMSTQSTKNKEIYECYCAGTKRDQSKLIFEECVNLLGGSPLKSKFKITKDKIIHIKTGSFLKALCKEDGKNGDGTNPAVLVLDEYHQHKTTEFYDLGLGANTKESLLMIITTAGMDLTYPCFVQEYKYCSNILNPSVDVVNDNYFVDICEIDKNDDIEDRRCWKKANPLRMTYAKGVQMLEDSYKVAKEIPEKMIPFLTKCLNKWVQAKENGYMDMAKWKACEVKKIPYKLDNRIAFIGGDMSAKIDLTSLAFVIPILDNGVKKYVVFSHSFIPNYEKLRERCLKDKMPYDAWEQQGFITVTNSPVVDQEQVIKFGIDFCKKYNWEIEKWCFDPANATKIMMDVENRGYSVTDLFQSHKMLNESTVALREEVYLGNVIYLPNPVLNFAMANAVVKTNNGLIKIDKDATTKRIDPVDALICGFKFAWMHEFDEYDPIDALMEQDW